MYNLLFDEKYLSFFIFPATLEKSRFHPCFSVPFRLFILPVRHQEDEPGGRPPAAGTEPGRRAFALHALRPGPASALWMSPQVTFLTSRLA